MEFEIVIAIDKCGGVGNNLIDDLHPSIPWKISEDMTHFKKITTTLPDTTIGRTKKNAIIMGRLTADSFKEVLPDRINMVITSKENYRSNEGFLSCSSLMESLKILRSLENVNKIFVIGGAKLVEEAVKSPCCRKLHLTRIDNNYNCQVSIPNDVDQYINNYYKVIDMKERKYRCSVAAKMVSVRFMEYMFNDSSEENYLGIMNNILENGHRRETRNGFVYSLFGGSLEFDMDKGFPLLTTKKMFTKGIVEELLFFLKGKTNTKLLEDKEVTIWHKNTTKEFIENCKLNLEEFDMGPMYGYQWRHFNAEYKGMNEDYTGKGFDQLKDVIDRLAKNGYARDLLMTTYNPLQVKQGILSPCHGIATQFYVDRDNRIEIMMHQRSADWFLGVPFNIASYALLLHIVTLLVNNNENNTKKIVYRPGRVIMTFGDHHIYEAHRDPALLQLSRMERIHRFPQLKIMKNLKTLTDIENLTFDDIVFENYVSELGIKAEMIA